MKRKNDLTEMKLTLKDWKNVELSCMNAMEEGKKQYLLNKEMLEHAIVQIKKLGGLTNAEEIEKEKREAEEAKQKENEQFAEKDKLALENNEPRP